MLLMEHLPKTAINIICSDYVAQLLAVTYI